MEYRVYRAKVSDRQQNRRGEFTNFAKNNFQVLLDNGFELRAFRHRSEQYFTSSQTFCHFLRQLNGKPQVAQIFCGRSRFDTFLGIACSFQFRLSIYDNGRLLDVNPKLQRYYRIQFDIVCAAYHPV